MLQNFYRPFPWSWLTIPWPRSPIITNYLCWPRSLTDSIADILQITPTKVSVFKLLAAQLQLRHIYHVYRSKVIATIYNVGYLRNEMRDLSKGCLIPLETNTSPNNVFALKSWPIASDYPKLYWTFMYANVSRSWNVTPSIVCRDWLLLFCNTARNHSTCLPSPQVKLWLGTGISFDPLLGN